MKKIIAREFLILIGSIIIFFFLFFVWIWLVDRNQEKEFKFESELSELTEFKKNPYRLRVYYFFKKEMDKNLDNPYEFITELKDSSVIVEKYNYMKKENKIDIPFSDFRDNILIDNQSEKYLTKTQNIEEVIRETRQSFFNNSIYDDELLGLGFGLFSIFFLLRYLIYSIKWSFKQLKE